MTRRRFLKLSAAASAFGLTTGLYTWRWEPHWIEFVHRPLRLPNLPVELIGTRLVQLSDLHIGRQVDDEYLLQTFERVKQLNPDIVLYTGDFISFEGDQLAHLRRLFCQLPLGREGTVGVLGNHDHGPGWSRPGVAAQIGRLGESCHLTPSIRRG